MPCCLLCIAWLSRMGPSTTPMDGSRGMRPLFTVHRSPFTVDRASDPDLGMRALDHQMRMADLLW